MAAEGMPFPWRLNRSTISAKLELIWEKSVQSMEEPMKTLSWLTPIVVSALILAGCEYRTAEVPLLSDPSMQGTLTKGGRDARLWDWGPTPAALAQISPARRVA